MLANSREQAHRYKTLGGQLSIFEHTVQIDTDVLVNGSLDYLFQVAERGDIGVFIPLFLEQNFNNLNSGVLCYCTSIFRPISQEWTERFDRVQKRQHNSMDQGILGHLFSRYKYDFSFSILPEEYNFCVKESCLGGSVLLEKRDYDKIKVFHFFTSHQYEPFNWSDKDLKNSISYAKFMKL